MTAFVAVALTSFLAAPVPKDQPKPVNLDGEWKMVGCLKNGERFKEDKVIVVTIKGDKMTINDGKRDEVANFTLDPKANPMTIDLKPVESEIRKKEIVIKGIYRLEKDQLTICFGQDGIERPKEFKSEANSGTVMFVLDRVKK